MQEKIGDCIFKVRSEDEMCYIRIIHALTIAMEITKTEKRRLKIMKKSNFFLILYLQKFNLI